MAVAGQGRDPVTQALVGLISRVILFAEPHPHPSGTEALLGLMTHHFLGIPGRGNVRLNAGLALAGGFLIGYWQARE